MSSAPFLYPVARDSMLTTDDLFAADFLWTFATAFVGRWVCVPEVVVQKRFYATSALGQWKTHSARHTFSEMAVLRRYLVVPAHGARAKMRALGVIAVLGILRSDGDLMHWTGTHTHW